MSELCRKFQIPASNTVGANQGQEQFYRVIWSKICMSFRGHNSAIVSWVIILFPYAHVQCMSELCSKFQILASNTSGVAETRTVLKSVTSVCTDVLTRVKLYMLLPTSWRGHKKSC